MIEHLINPALFKVGIFEIRYYGVIYLLAFVLGYFFLNYLVKLKGIKLDKEGVADYLFYLLVGTVAGARVFYVFVYNLKYYLGRPFEIFALWNGGLSFHGGLIGAIIACIIFCRMRKINALDMMDITVIPLAFGLFLGRIGNFLNGELVGRVTNVPWCIDYSKNPYINEVSGCRHPSQIYESLKNLFIFFVLWSIKAKDLPKGFLMASFIVMYSVLRFFIEFFREPDIQLGYLLFGLTMGQILNILMFISGIAFIWAIWKKQKSSA